MVIKKSCTVRRKKSRFADEIGERYGEIEYTHYTGGKVLQRWRGSSDSWNLRRCA